MTDLDIRQSHYLVTYEWRSLRPHSSNKWRRENKVIKGCPGLWWAQHLEWYRNNDDAYREKCRDYEKRGEKMPLSEQQSEEEQRFICATPITREAHDALDGVVG
jgi:hypothetical protein